jgi:glycosyltransferase involved in cell wall biosynthesis
MKFHSPPASGDDNQTIFATIGHIAGSHVQVWIDDGGNDVLPMVTVGKIAARQASEALDYAFMSRTGKAYDFYVSGLKEGEEVSLWLYSGQRLELCETRYVKKPSFERSIVKQLARAAKIAQEPGAVAVACWSGGHNAIGRAKVLYDVLAGRRPVVLFAFLFSEFGGDIWPPLTESNAVIVTIPWAERYFFLRMACQMGLTFDTVWMCKPRMPTFELSAALAAPDSALILDIDDNEEEFSSAKGARKKAYGLTSIGLSRFTMENVPARTAPSISIQQDFKTHIVRHARRTVPVNKLDRTKPLRVGFIGTVRPHKRIVEAAEAIKALNANGSCRFEFHVYGDVWPAEIRDALTRNGAVVMGHVQLDDLSNHIAQFHIILTGFPCEIDEDTPITRYQISSKIGDALSVGRPVLVPTSASVADLADVPGVFLFNTSTFSEQITAAAEQVGHDFALPEEFTFCGAFKAFLAAEKEARGAKPAAQALAHIPASFGDEEPQPTLLLLWKQQDSGLYGRRPDILARSYAQAFPDHRVVLLELLYPDVDKRHRSDHSNLSEQAYIRDLNTRKSKTVTDNGVEYHQLRIADSDQIEGALIEYLGANAILPTNTIIVLFPYIRHLQNTYDLLSSYTVVTDVVDNHLAWAPESRRAAVIRQYFALYRLSDRVIFNSARNMEAFREQGLLTGTEDKTLVIPNWYKVPTGFTVPELNCTGDRFNIFYTGNMNDRIDWSLLAEIAALHDRVRLHLVGEARRSFDQLAELLETKPNVVFHGVKNERMSLHMLSQADLAVIPHLVDKVSKFMNPMKVHMYAALGLPTISTDVPGIEATDLLTISPSREAFLDEVRLHLGRGPGQPRLAGTRTSEQSDSYIALLNALRQATR